MTQRDIERVGERERPLRVAIVGSGPAGFYAAEALFRQREGAVEIDMFERLPAPFGLVRSGVAPDHQRIKQAAKAFERTASQEGFRFFGNVDVGTDVTIDELGAIYDQVLLATGSARDRALGVPGEDLEGVHSALSFVGWYNGHPEFVEERFDLSVERAVVVGVGNVAMDVTRTLVRRPSELVETDIAGYALAALEKSRVREVVVLGRRGPAQAAFTLSELKDIAELAGVQVFVEKPPLEAARRHLERLDAGERRLFDYLSELSEAPDRGTERRVRLQFLASPREVIGESGRVRAISIEDNEIAKADNGELVAQGTGRTRRIDAGLILRAIGFFGIAIPGLPFDERSGVIPNVGGRVLGVDGQPLPGVYVVGWIKRGPRGLIGSNKVCASETVKHMLEDAERAAERERTTTADIDALLSSRGVRSVSFPEWRVLDEMERAAGHRLGKVRDKFTSIQAMLQALAGADRAAKIA